MPTPLPSGRVVPRFAGLVTFGRYPRLSDLTAEYGEVDWLIYGVPHDGGVTYRPGARFGPRAIREASQYLKPYSLHHGVDVPGVLTLADAGDAPVLPYDERTTLMSAADWATALASDQTRAARLLALGGDHSIAYANILASWRRAGSPAGGLALLHFDAHLDTVDEVWGSQWGHASPFIRLIEEGVVDPRRMISIGIRGPLTRSEDLRFARERGVRIVTADAIRRELVSGECATLRSFVGELAGAPAYVTFDIDCVDPAFAPGTGTPCPGGLTSWEALALVRSCVGASVVGADVVEVLPVLDHAEVTALLAAHIAFEVLSLTAAGRRGVASPGAS